MKKHVEIFASSGDDFNSFTRVQEDANLWLKEHPQAKLLDSHTAMVHIPSEYTYKQLTLFSLTLIVELPEEA